MAVAVFDSALFKARYPEFALVADLTLLSIFSEAGLYLSNTDDSIVSDVSRRLVFLNMITAHILKLSGIATGSGPSGVGRVSSAAEGSVNVSLEYSAPGGGDWFNQTQYGAAFWQATVNYRRFLYIPQKAVY